MNEPLKQLETICDEIFERWDKDQRSGKLLSALAGRLSRYRDDVDAVREALGPGAPEDRKIILALFAPQTAHERGCLTLDPHFNGPCQCGFSSVVGNYRWALKRAKEIATAHHGAAFDAAGPSIEDEPESASLTAGKVSSAV